VSVVVFIKTAAILKFILTNFMSATGKGL
jgi:hypothetical protein